MKKQLTIFIFLLWLISCKPEKEIQVESEAWRLVEKKVTERFIDNEWIGYVWLVWENRDKTRFNELIKAEQANKMGIGTVVYNRIVR